ncbi:hypothetical protein ApDm4_1192 [Acetobacter pomorum]|nr:hypothetical protein ApDm4_1192 [Acetobacter pomorum]
MKSGSGNAHRRDGDSEENRASHGLTPRVRHVLTGASNSAPRPHVLHQHGRDWPGSAAQRLGHQVQPPHSRPLSHRCVSSPRRRRDHRRQSGERGNPVHVRHQKNRPERGQCPA